MTTLIRKQFVAEISPADEKGPVRVVLSTGSVDRDGDTIDPSGWDLEAYAKNPVVLFGHDRRSPPVGRALRVWTEGGALKADVEFAPTEDGRECEALVRGGFLSAASVGFEAVEYGPRKSEDGTSGIAFSRQELLEFSFVTIPANAEALVEQRAARDAIAKSFTTAAQPPMPEVPAQEAVHMDAETKGAAESATITVTQEQIDAIAAKAASAAVERALRTTTTDPSATVVDAAAKHATAPVVGKWVKCRKAQTIEPGTDKGLGAARVALSYALSRSTPGMSVAEAAKHLGYAETADALEETSQSRKALGESTIAAGGAFVPDVFSSTFIDVLSEQAVIRPLIPGTCKLSMLKGSQLSVPEFTSLPTSSFLGEATAPANSTPATALRMLDLKWMATEVVIGKDWVSDAIPGIDQLVRARMARSAALREDLALVEGTGSESEPRGIKLYAGNNVQATGSPDLAKSNTDINKLRGYLEDNSVMLDGDAAFVGNPIHFRGLDGFVDGMGGYPWRREMDERGTLRGLKFAKSAQFSKTAANSCFYLGNFGHTLLVDGAMEIEEDTQYVSSGTTHSASARRQIVLRLWRRIGFMVTHPKAFAYLHTCTWGA